ncbi:helix-turn-helix domain-containing protein [Delftia sp. DT-2]|jgi:transcriptional regulator with XRE-family HTH domain|uniref:helix-turn-helix domain-containing protein n=1 Tax=Delftia sp. DT-2 TaxID=3022772 RepID=UPI00233F0150|nr:helix-turn-helix transcriptional regulator [Delftia sp. DT-2]MDC2857349.1 helix-turn-helix transcriptional regulator [Delftia sp. DT-2]MDR3016429.1 helix-turn-helix domain-containing protein [Delftia acidovorans]
MLGEALRLIRVYHDLTQTQLSYELGLSNSFLSEVESGKKIPSLEILGKYSERFDISMSSLLFFSESLDEQKFGSKIKFSVGKKVLTLLEWAANTSKKRTTAKV